MNNSLPIKEYERIINSIGLDEAAKHEIIRNCARRSTLERIRRGKYKLITVKKDEAKNF